MLHERCQEHLHVSTREYLEAGVLVVFQVDLDRLGELDHVVESECQFTLRAFDLGGRASLHGLGQSDYLIVHEVRLDVHVHGSVGVSDLIELIVPNGYVVKVHQVATVFTFDLHS